MAFLLSLFTITLVLLLSEAGGFELELSCGDTEIHNVREEEIMLGFLFRFVEYVLHTTP